MTAGMGLFDVAKQGVLCTWALTRYLTIFVDWNVKIQRTLHACPRHAVAWVKSTSPLRTYEDVEKMQACACTRTEYRCIPFSHVEAKAKARAGHREAALPV